MARVRKSGTKGAGSDGRTVRLSVVMGWEDHQRLAALALATGRTIQGCVLDAVLPTLAAVRVPWVVGAARPEEPAEPAAPSPRLAL